jgi:hypothetical protein
MKNDAFSIISRFHVASISLALFLILSIGTKTLYSILIMHETINMQAWMMVTWSICAVWLLFFTKDWIAYYKLFKNSNHLIKDERFKYHSNKATKLAFIALVMSNFSILLVDSYIYSLSTVFAAIFSLVFGISVYLLVHIILELRE